ncbi:MAG TPA: signal peptide peptidase SppA [Bacteroidetes bacterium]|nr:signal peptide peptidase SppA [Bacteroidota bacterium]
MSKSTKWFLIIFGILVVVGAGFFFLLYGIMRSVGERTEVVTTGYGSKIAVVELEGVITSSEDIVRQMKKYRESNSIKGILLRVDSPGGGVVASQEIYEEVRKTRESGKPVVVSMGALAASGGYYVACGASRLVANRGTLTGSIGVISEFMQLKDALDKLGVSFKTIKSGKLKDSGSSTRKMTEEDERYFQQLMDDVHRQFISVVESERHMDHDLVVKIADGRVFTGEQAVENGLVDTLGTLEDAINITAELSGISGEPSIVKERKRRSIWEGIFGDVEESLKDLKQELLEKPALSYRFVGPY